MSNPDDRIPVPTNGHHRLPAEDDAPGSPGVAAATVARALDEEGLDAPSATDPIDEATDAPRIIVTPGQATAVGFGILAGLALLVLGRRRGRHG